MTGAGRFAVSALHPALPGHFPGRPVVPGVVLLDEAIALLLARHPGHRAAGLPQVKFLRPVQARDAVDVLCGVLDDGRLAFSCRVGDDEVARGTLSLERLP